MSNSVLQTPKVQKIIDALSAKVSKESMKQEGKKRDVTFDDTTTPPTVVPIKTFLHEPVRGGRFKGYENPITGNGNGPQMTPHVEDTL